MLSEDLDQVVENELRSYEFPWGRGIFVDCMKSKYECWVVCDGDNVIGHGILSAAAAGDAHLLNLCLCRTRQGEGHGRVLADHVIRRARSRGASEVYLEVRTSNVVAIDLYESLGFNEIGVGKNYYPSRKGHEDAMIFALDLSAYFCDHRV
jgi:ribosomal-protein-alanine N-acetyltransferase